MELKTVAMVGSYTRMILCISVHVSYNKCVTMMNRSIVLLTSSILHDINTIIFLHYIQTIIGNNVESDHC